MAICSGVKPASGSWPGRFPFAFHASTRDVIDDAAELQDTWQGLVPLRLVVPDMCIHVRKPNRIAKRLPSITLP